MRKLLAGLLLVPAMAAVSSKTAAQISISSPSVMEQGASPGESYSGTVLLRNRSAEMQEAKIYQTDYLTFADGTTSYGEAGSTPRSNARWITIQPTYVTVPPHQTIEARYTVRVPAASASPLAGSYWSMIMVEGIPKGSAESRVAAGAQRKVQVGIVTRLRYAVQIVTNIGTTGSRKVQFANPKTIATGNGKELQFDLVNTGERAYAPRISLELYTEAGEQAAVRTTTRELTYPGTSLRQSFDLGGLAAGRYRALVVVDAGGDDVFGAQFTIAL
ncbi:MAG TPA: hypothetical protein VFK04_14595 [Gemmatimonadaceae bacterium]|jgi:hypothetical protein|nr:hypothetical protein [Gemmatimonadaceae bacterium]